MSESDVTLAEVATDVRWIREEMSRFRTADLSMDARVKKLETFSGYSKGVGTAVVLALGWLGTAIRFGWYR